MQDCKNEGELQFIKVDLIRDRRSRNQKRHSCGILTVLVVILSLELIFLRFHHFLRFFLHISG